MFQRFQQTFMDYVMRRRSTVGGALEIFSLPLPLPFKNRIRRRYEVLQWSLGYQCTNAIINLK